MAARMFLAVDLNDSILDALGQVRRQLDDPQAKIRWVARANQHVTMQFLGDVADDAIPDICNAAGEATGRIEPFDFEVTGVTCVPPAGRQLRMIWAMIADSSGGLSRLQDELSSNLADLGFKPEKRPFRPHLTLARVKHIGDVNAMRQAAEAYASAEFGLQRAAELVAYSSKLTPDGSVYTPISRSRLGR